MTATTMKVAALRPSDSNPRKQANKAADKELRASINELGILSPLTVKSDGEIISGHRRWRAAQELGLEDVPVLVRDDLVGADDVAAAQIVENLQRADLPPVDEAEAYKKLRDKYQLEVVEIAARVAKSESYVYKRLQLAELCKEGRQALRKGGLSTAGAMMIARVPPELQPDLVDELAQDGAGEPLPVSEIRWALNRRYVLELAEAPFPVKDAKLVEGVPACGACPKMTSNAPLLFDDLADKARCTDPGCWEGKSDAAWEREKTKHEAKGHPVLSDAESRDALSWDQGRSWDVSHRSAYVKTTARIDRWDPKSPTWSKLLGKSKPAPYLGRTSRGRAVKLYKLSELKAAAKKAGVKLPKSSSSTSSTKSSAATKKAKLEVKIAKEAATKIVGELRERIREDGPSDEVLRYVLLDALNRGRYGRLDLPDARQDEIDRVATGAEVPGLDWTIRALAEVEVGNLVEDVYDKKLPKDLMELANVHGVDHAAIHKATRAELTPTPKKKRTAKKKPATKKPGGKK